jgi:O-antigen/teichoic acid export membrane protein
MISSLRALWLHFVEDNLFRNSIYLMVTTGAMGGFGFFFWIICTHLYTPEQIGLGTTLISAMTLISFISLLGFNTTFVRFLPNSENRNEEINTGSLLVMSTAIIISIVYILLIPFITPKLIIVRGSLWYSLGFIIIVALASINTLSDSIFVAYRSAQYNLITDGFITSVIKLLLPLLLINFGAYGVFASSGLGASAGMIASVLFLVFKFSYHPTLRINFAILKRVFKYSFVNYLSNLINIIPTLVLPIIIINHLGAAASGYYYLAFMVINLLYSVSGSVSQSLFAEGSYSNTLLRPLILRSSIILLTLMVPAIVVLVIFGPVVLEFFGKSYSTGASSVIIILALAAPAIAAYNVGNVLLRIRHQIYSMLLTSAVYAFTITFLTIYWVDKGLAWVAMAWTAGNIAAAVLSFIFIFIYRGQSTPIDIS